jgi:hypothetical protein
LRKTANRFCNVQDETGKAHLLRRRGHGRISPRYRDRYLTPALPLVSKSTGEA